MTTTTSTTAMIAARRRDAARKEAAVEQALGRMVRRREPITVSGVAARAGVSRSYLSRHPVLGDKVRGAATASPPRTARSTDQPTTVEAALRHHIRGLQAAQEKQLTSLRAQLRGLEQENAALRGELLACDRPPVAGR